MKLKTLMDLAYKSHEDQLDKGGAPYILHPMRVALNVHSKVARLKIFKDESHDTFERAIKACIGHDLIEDTKVTSDDLFKRGLDEDVLWAIMNMTKKDKESYSDFAKRCMTNTVSWIGKIADIVDNCDIERISPEKRSPKDGERMNKYITTLLEMGVEADELEWLLTYN